MLLSGILILLGIIGIRFDIQSNKMIKLMKEYLQLEKDYTDNINFNVDYLCGGYENYTSEMKSFLDDAMIKTGLVFDTTYSGKAFYGMMDMIEKLNLKGNMLFWHTGGIMNLMK